MQRLYLMRHGETQSNAAGILQGGLDSPLTERGAAQAQAADSWMRSRAAKIGAVCTSPLGRARQTLEIMRNADSHLAALPIEVEPCLSELRYGAFEGHALGDLPDDPWKPGETYRAHGGEAQADTSVRIVHGLARIMRKHPDADVLAISHGTVMGLFWAASSRNRTCPPPSLDNGCILIFDFDRTRGVFTYLEEIVP
ncbi:histidine phosphatase family protein [Collinsella tanakaei]|uniref:histidine phosphatase family protein n=1 Tax=Collinsella tanakaei TaxID=626935 RepID=UPI0025A41210|nr:histidine phosphatase family protein [Collinsella tanakaei]MDM8245726.1 histidine phosphatase family protein [Collinsella tanakaei]